MITKDEVLEAFAMLHRAREEAYLAAKKEGQLKENLKLREWYYILEGRIDGKNQEIRESQLCQLTAGERDAYLTAKETNALSEIRLEQAKDRCRCASLLVELMKLEKED